MKIIIISLHYGEEGSGGARRAFLWAKGLRRLNHEVHVVSPYVTDEFPGDVLIPHPIRKDRDSKTPVQKPGFVEKNIKSHLRNWIRWPDPEIIWYRIVIQAVLEKHTAADWVITTSPPESAHTIGEKLSKKLNAYWCAELRDSWIEDSHRSYIKGLRGKIESRLAHRWMKNAEAVTSVNKRILREAKSLAPNALGVEIGHFSEPFTGTIAQLPENKFNLLHAGGFTQSDRRRKLGPLLKELSPVMSERADLHLHLIGPLSHDEIKMISNSTLPITYHGWVTLSESRALQAASDAVLLYTPLTDTLALPGKYAEYCNLRKPIIFLGSEHVRAMAHRREEFYALSSLIDMPKGRMMPEETHATVDNATQQLISLLEDVSQSRPKR